MADEQTIGEGFISRLLENPALTSFSPLQKEQHIINFLKQNSVQLYPTLSSAQYFPGKTRDQIFTIIHESLKRVINKSLFPLLQRIVEQGLDLSFMASLQGNGGAPRDIHARILDFLQRLMQKDLARINFNGPLTALETGISDRYIDESFARKSYLHFELTKVQKLTLSPGEIKNMVKLSLLLKTGINLLAVDGGAASHEARATTVQSQFADKVLPVLREQLHGVPEEVLKSALQSNTSFLENAGIGATARITAIFAARCTNYRQFAKVDRGADTPDKSWFNIARRNYRFYGFDGKMLDEFYIIAAEKGW
jgi:hypothetical protein